MYRNFAIIAKQEFAYMSYVKKFMCRMTENMQADEVLILNPNKTIDKKSSHNPYMQDYAPFFV